MFTQASEGALITFLASAKPRAFEKAVQAASRPARLGTDSPKHRQNVANFLHAVRDGKSNARENFLSRPDALPMDQLSKSIEVLLNNKVKKCSHCHKPNAFTLAVCNQCGSDLTQTAVSLTNNVFSGFILGFEYAGPIPLKISMRHATDNFLVMDDLLALSPLHFNVIPTSQYLPDWRYLLLRPRKGLQLVTEMFESCVQAGSQLMENTAWRSKFFREDRESFDLHRHIGAGFNYPPSQYQLHIQFIAPCLVPFHWAQFLKGVHFTHGRFFPFSFLRDVLQKLVDVGVGEGVDADTASLNSNDSIVRAFQDLLPQNAVSSSYCLEDEDCLPSIDAILSFCSSKLKISYNEAHAKHMSDFSRNQSLFSNWKQEDFDGFILTSTSNSKTHTDRYLPNEQDSAKASDIPTTLVSADKIILQSYGRPYNDMGSPSGTYYGFAKNVDDLTLW